MNSRSPFSKSALLLKPRRLPAKYFFQVDTDFTNKETPLKQKNGGQKDKTGPCIQTKRWRQKDKRHRRVRRDAKRKNRIVTKKWWQEDEEGTALENFGKKLGAKR